MKRTCNDLSRGTISNAPSGRLQLNNLMSPSSLLNSSILKLGRPGTTERTYAATAGLRQYRSSRCPSGQEDRRRNAVTASACPPEHKHKCSRLGPVSTPNTLQTFRRIVNLPFRQSISRSSTRGKDGNQIISVCQYFQPEDTYRRPIELPSLDVRQVLLELRQTWRIFNGICNRFIYEFVWRGIQELHWRDNEGIEARDVSVDLMQSLEFCNL